jgi:hypothetical protein
MGNSGYAMGKSSSTSISFGSGSLKDMTKSEGKKKERVDTET